MQDRTCLQGVGCVCVGGGGGGEEGENWGEVGVWFPAITYVTCTGKGVKSYSISQWAKNYQ